MYTNRIFIVSTAPMTDDEIKIIESSLVPSYHNRIKYHDWYRDNQTAFIDLKADQHPDEDEVSIFIDQMDDAGYATFWGEPFEDFSNHTGQYQIYNWDSYELPSA